MIPEINFIVGSDNIDFQNKETLSIDKISTIQSFLSYFTCLPQLGSGYSVPGKKEKKKKRKENPTDKLIDWF